MDQSLLISKLKTASIYHQSWPKSLRSDENNFFIFYASNEVTIIKKYTSQLSVCFWYENVGNENAIIIVMQIQNMVPQIIIVVSLLKFVKDSHHIYFFFT